MALERSEIDRAIRESDNLSEAARKLGASRRTLQNRMRAYKMPRGKSGRRKRALAIKRNRGAVVVVAGMLAAVAAGVLITRA